MKEKLKVTQAVDHLRTEELKSYLKLIFLQIQLLKEPNDAPERAIAELIDLYDGMMRFHEKAASWDPAKGCTSIHIVFGDSFAGSMKQALNGLGWSDTHKLVTMADDYAIGPLGRLDLPEGRKARSDWFRDHISGAFEMCMEFEDEYNELLYKLNQIPNESEVIVWTSRSVREQVGMRHALYLLRRRRNAISVYDACAICEKLYNRPDTFIEYKHSGEIPPDKLREALLRVHGSGKLHTADITRLAQEWIDISEQGGTLRIWQDSAVIEVPADYYDNYLLEKLDGLKPPATDHGFLRAARLIGEAMGYCEQHIGDSYFEYRLRELIYGGILEIKGIPAGMRYYSIRRKQPSGM